MGHAGAIFLEDNGQARSFVEEAQIGGQLQHPGVVPIYELGTFGEGRPYFTMKLVKGQTLGELLAERESPAVDLPRFLNIFHQMCQTMAYAHARDVIHRDLKPSNVMVGSFGEVQVMDWGLAKVLPRGGVVDDAGPRPAPAHQTVIAARIGTWEICDNCDMSDAQIEAGIRGKFRLVAVELDERRRRQWAAAEALELGSGGSIGGARQ